MQRRNCAILAATLATVTSAFAEATDVASDAPRVTYRGAPGCPDENVFLAHVQARTPRAVLAREGESAVFAVVVSASETGSSAQVERTDGQASVVRQISGKTCDEVVSAAALITALGLEARRANADPPRAEDAENQAVPVRDVTPPAPFAPDGARWSAGAAFGIDSWSAPGGALSASGFAEVGAASPLRYVRLRFRGASGSTSMGERGATFLLLVGGLSVCPVAAEIAPRLELAPCVGVEAGNLHGTGEKSTALPNPRSADIFWAAGYADLRLRWRAAEVLSVELTAEVGVPLVRHDFTFEGPSAVIYALPAIGGGGALGAVAHFP